MKAMILAAGKGKRMLPLTLTTPKPMLEARGKPLIVHHIDRLREAGIREIVINTAHLGHVIHARLKDGRALGVSIRYSHEGPQGLETAGGIRRARPLLGREPFILVNADIWTDFIYDSLSMDIGGLAQLVLVGNPEHNPGGDFALDGETVANAGPDKLTFAGISVISPALLDLLDAKEARLAPYLRAAADLGQVTGLRHHGEWFDIGTPERLQRLNLSAIATAG